MSDDKQLKGQVLKNVKNHVSNSLEDASSRVLTIPNFITFIRILLVPIFAISIANKFDILAVCLIVICSVSDFLDGFLARKYNQVTKVGKILDPVADRLMIFVTLIMLTARGIIPVWALLVMFLRETMLFFLYGSLIMNGKETLPVKYIGKVGTAGLLFAMPVLFFASSDEIMNALGVDLSVMRVFGLIILTASLVVYWVAGIIYAKESVEILQEVHSHTKRKILISAFITVIVAAVLISVVIVFVPNATVLIPQGY
ncbi:MAG: CDP-alcohol phosphatidyltransferase family protein [Candidatus Ancillula sp.]|nr:CDP-alcohol phosphatidyltransferase family protein [Candidatus Ancillula sp.]